MKTYSKVSNSNLSAAFMVKVIKDPELQQQD